MRYAAHKHTAAEVIFERVDNKKPVVGIPILGSVIS